MTTLLLLTALLAQTDARPLTNYYWVSINRPFEALQEFADNEFIHEEKLAAAEKDAEQYKDRKVLLVVAVRSVQKTSVSVKFFAEININRQLPHVWLVNDPEADVNSLRVGGESVVGRGHGNLLGSLEIGEHLPLDLAKTLRQGDRLAISGVVREIKALKLGNNPNAHVARGVIVVNKIEKIDDQDD